MERDRRLMGLLLTLSGGRATLRTLRAVQRAALATVVHTRGVQRTTYDVVPNARKILHPAASNQDDRVLLEVVPLAGDVCRHLELVRQTDTGDLPKRRVRLLRRGRVNARADSPLLRVAPHCR